MHNRVSLGPILAALLLAPVATGTAQRRRIIDMHVHAQDLWAEPGSIEPDVHIFTRSKLGWVRLPEAVPAFEIYYDTKSLWPAASLERLAAVMPPAG